MCFMFIYILSLLCLFSSLCAVDTVDITLHAYNSNWHAFLDTHITDSFVLEGLSFESDVYIEDTEFYYLVGLKEGQVVTKQDLQQSLSFLFKKNKFQSIRLMLMLGKRGKHIHMDLKSFWTFERLKLHGWMLGKEQYRRYYLLEPGEQFDIQKHEQSLHNITEQFAREGFFNASIESYYDYDVATKSVTAHALLHKGEQFYINNVTLTIDGNNLLPEYDRDVLYVHLHKFFIKTLLGTRYSKELLNKETAGLHHYLACKGFLHSEIQLQEFVNKKKKQVDLHFIIHLRHKKEFVFIGNHFFSTTQLRENLLLFGRSAWLLPASILSEEIMRAYHKKGFWSVEVQAREEGGRYFFIITEGPRATISTIELQHVTAFDRRHLGRSSFVELRKSHYFDQNLMQKGFDRLLQSYIDAGFWDATIVHHDFVPTKKSQKYMLRVVVNEGIRSYLHSVTIPGYEELLDLGPFALTNKKGEAIIVTPHLLNEQRMWLLNYFIKKGYQHIDVKPEVQREESKVFVTWHVQTQAQMCFGKTIIQGSSTFPYKAIMRELRYKQGDIWNKEQLKESFVKLKELEIFSTVHLSPSVSEHNDSCNDIILKFQKDDPFEVRVRGGLEVEHLQKPLSFGGLTYRLGGTFITKNPFNKGGQLRLDTEFTRVHREVIVRYIRPWLVQSPVRTTFQVYAIKHDQPGFKSFKNLYQVRQDGFSVAMNKDFNWGQVSINSGFEWMETSISDKTPQMKVIADRIARAINFNMALLDKYVPFYFIEPTLFLDLLDNKLSPTKGSLTVLSFKSMIPLRKKTVPSYFVKIIAEQSFFIPINKVVLALHMRIGHIFHQKFENIMPSERFYLGGANSVRSYETDNAPPLGLFIDENDKEQCVPQGGRSMVNGNFEIRFPLYQEVGGTFFHDIGALSSNKLTDIKPEDVIAGSGFGLSYNTPIGPLRFDIGFKWRVIKPFERSFAWFLAFGHAF